MASPHPLPLVSVLMPAYNCAAYLGDALRSLQAQTMASWEAIVVDDGSPDDVAGALAPFADDARIRHLATEHGGLAMARNRALDEVRAPVVALLDGDDLYEPDYLDAMMHELRDEKVGFVTCDARFFGLPRLEGRRFSEITPQRPPVTLDRVLRREFNIFGACMIRVTALREVGGWTAGLPSAEDLDLWLRLLGAGWRCGFVARPLHDYRRRSDSLSAARLPLLEAVVRVYDAAQLRLSHRFEGETARQMLGLINEEIAFERGQALVLAGRVREGLHELRRAGPRTRSAAWRAAMLGMRLIPTAAAGFMRWRIAAAERG